MSFVPAPGVLHGTPVRAVIHVVSVIPTLLLNIWASNIDIRAAIAAPHVEGQLGYVASIGDKRRPPALRADDAFPCCVLFGIKLCPRGVIGRGVVTINIGVFVRLYLDGSYYRRPCICRGRRACRGSIRGRGGAVYST